jgi:hypothetical protein
VTPGTFVKLWGRDQYRTYWPSTPPLNGVDHRSIERGPLMWGDDYAYVISMHVVHEVGERFIEHWALVLWSDEGSPRMGYVHQSCLTEA